MPPTCPSNQRVQWYLVEQWVFLFLHITTGYVNSSLKAAHSSVKAKMAMAILGFRSTTSTLTCIHPSGGVVGSCGSGYSFRTQHSPSVPQSTTLSACWLVCNAKRSIREHDHYLTVLGP